MFVSATSVAALLLAGSASAQEAARDGAGQAAAAGRNAAAAGSQATQDEADAGVIQDIIVTAQKTQSTLQKTPLAITVVGGNQITDEARTAADDVLKNVPGVEVQGAARGLVVAIRGLGSDLPPGVGESSVSTNYDGVYNIRAEAAVLGFYDLDRVEVLRGPQSTLYGRNATGGVVNVVSAVPELGNTSGYVSFGTGNYDLARVEGAINLPFGETVALRVSGTAIARDGFLSNGHNDQVGQGGRAKLIFKPDDALTVIAGVEATHVAGHGPGAVEVANFESGKAYTTADSGIGGQNYTGYKYWTQVDVRAGPGTFTILPAYQTGSGTVQGFFGGRGTNGWDPRRVRQKSLEARYASNPGAPVTWLVGYYHYDYLQHTISYADATYGSDDGFTRNTGNSDAVFGQLTVPLTSALRLIGGARYTWDKRHATGTGLTDGTIYDGEVRGRFFDYRAGAEVDVARGSLLYGTVASAFRPGGVNPFNGGTYWPERLTSFEVGAKNRFLDDRLQVNASAFYYDYTDFQVVDFFIGATGPNLVFYNADARNYGAELETQWLVTREDRINLSLAYLDSKITGDLVLHPEDPFSAVNFKGERLPHSPRWSLKGGYEHVFTLASGAAITPRVDGRYVTAQAIAPNNSAAARQGAYLTGDASLGYAFPNAALTLTAYVKNVTDKAVKTGYFVGYLTVAAPRTYGVSLTSRF